MAVTQSEEMSDISNEIDTFPDENKSLVSSEIVQSETECSSVSDTDTLKNKLIFKKPVLIGPRKGKGVVKHVFGKTVGDSETSYVREQRVEVSESESETVSEHSTVSNVEKDKGVVKEIASVSPAQNINESSIPLPYKEPKWSGLPNVKYSFEILKNGGIIETIDLSSKPYFVFGRLVTCDVHMAHPTVSRFHAVLQYRKDGTDDAAGFYIYDLGSTHGTFLNKLRIKPNLYVRVHVGHILKFGGSSRMFILQGPPTDMEKESELTITELKEKYKEEKLARELQELKELEEQQIREEKEKNDGVDWGMGEDADEETDLSENPFAAAPNEELYLDDPKKTLRGWFEREGYDLEYNVEEKGFGQFLCRVELPVESAKGGTIVAEALVKGKKKEAVVQCALESCRILDRYGLLRQAKHESRKRKAKNWEENDYYDSDEDEFLDRTGAVERKRQQRMKAAGKIETQTDTYETLVEKLEEITAKVKSIEEELQKLTNSNPKNSNISDEEDVLDAFMSNLSAEIPDNKLISKLKSELLLLKKEELHVTKLVNIACPASLPKLIDSSQTVSTLVTSKEKTHVGFHKSIGQPTLSVEKECHSEQKTKEHEKNTETIEVDKEEEEEEEDEDEDEEEAEKIDKDKDHIKDEQNTNRTDIDVNDELLKEEERSEINSKKIACVGQSARESNSASSTIANNSLALAQDCNKAMDNNSGNGVKKDTVIGPALPPENFTSEESQGKRKKKQRQRQQRKSTKQYENVSSDPNYSMWVPPEGQSGDGKTKLNEKYGY